MVIIYSRTYTTYTVLLNLFFMFRIVFGNCRLVQYTTQDLNLQSIWQRIFLNRQKVCIVHKEPKLQFHNFTHSAYAMRQLSQHIVQWLVPLFFGHPQYKSAIRNQKAIPMHVHGLSYFTGKRLLACIQNNPYEIPPLKIYFLAREATSHPPYIIYTYKTRKSS